jgi:choline dehydrogenase-like flavoprotein
MDHPRLYSGSITLNEPWSRNKLFDIKFDCQNPTVSAFGTQISGQFSLSPKTQRAERITNAQIWFSSVFPGEYTEAAEALVRMKRRWGQKEEQGPTLMQDLLTLAKEPLNTAGFALARLFHPRALIKTVRFQAIAEPEPDRDARVTLSCERDKLGLHRVRVNWRLGPIVRRTFDRNFAILADELQRAGVATVTLDPPIEHRSEWPESLHHEGTWHHMGTTRMHESPKQGVVDRNGLVHGMSNLYVAGSSVFTTAGANFPTMTLVALALRLADHLALRLRTPSEAVIHPIRRVVNEAGAVSG